MPLQFFVVTGKGRVRKEQGKIFCLYSILLYNLSSSSTTGLDWKSLNLEDLIYTNTHWFLSAVWPSEIER